MTDSDDRTTEKTLIIAPGDALAAMNAPSARLVCTDATVLANESAREIRLLGGGASLGRGSDNTVVIKAEGVSRQHARLYPGEGAWGIEDLKSRNGVAVNKARVQQAWLKDGDLVHIGNVTYRYVVDGPGAGEPPQAQADLAAMNEQTLMIAPSSKAAPEPAAAPTPAPKPAPKAAPAPGPATAHAAPSGAAPASASPPQAVKSASKSSKSTSTRKPATLYGATQDDAGHLPPWLVALIMAAVALLAWLFLV